MRYLVVLVMLLYGLASCKKSTGNSGPDGGLLPSLSDYRIYKGELAKLHPADDFVLYELPTPLFTDYAEKQRLIKIPAGAQLKGEGNGLPEFPEGTLLVKTFFYFLDKSRQISEKKVVETRILWKKEGRWLAGTYVWNPEQTDAVLFGAGLNETVHWKTETGEAKVISYHIPNKKACATCHDDGGTLLPLGVKMRNLNRVVERSGISVNQLRYFQDRGLLSKHDTSVYASLPDWTDATRSVEERSRAYLDMNCAHCHNDKGFAAGSNLLMNYEVATEDSRILQRSTAIIDEMEAGRMPRIGTSVIDREALSLLKSFLKKN